LTIFQSTRQILRRSTSPDSSFDHTQDSIMEDSLNSFEDSQDTVVTVPDDPTPAAILPPQVAQTQAHPPRVVPTEEVRLVRFHHLLIMFALSVTQP
jgi:hypothetical protein